MMSGTSVDGMDVALVRFKPGATRPGWSHEVLAVDTLTYPEALRQSLWGAMGLTAEGLQRLHRHWSLWAARATSNWLAQEELPDPDVVASHGHTVFHRPDEGWTFQVGCGATLHANLGFPVVCDFRQLDMAHGGQGAPLVPMADRELFGQWDVALNLGGFANLSQEQEGRGRVAWDVGFANLLLNILMEEVGQTMDRDGLVAAQGKAIPGLLSALKALPFHLQTPPKSTGREWLERKVLPCFEPHAEAPLADRLMTAIHCTAWAVAKDIPEGSRVLVTGGGAHNPVLMARLRQEGEARGISFHVPEQFVVDGKEALAFALLGLQRALDLPNAEGSWTGASSPSVGGALWGTFPAAGRSRD